MEQGAWLVGTAEQVTEKIKAIEERYPGLEHMHVGCNRMAHRWRSCSSSSSASARR